MNLHYLLILLLGLSFSCTTPASNSNTSTSPPSRDEQVAQIRQLEQKLRQQINPNLIDTATAQQLITQSLDFKKEFPTDSLTPIFIFKAADVSRGIGKYQQAISLWEVAHEFFRDTIYKPQALFLQAFTYDKDLNNDEKAMYYYEQFMARYPRHRLVKDANMLLQMLRNEESPEELIKKFKKAEGRKE